MPPHAPPATRVPLPIITILPAYEGLERGAAACAPQRARLPLITILPAWERLERGANLVVLVVLAALVAWAALVDLGCSGRSGQLKPVLVVLVKWGYLGVPKLSQSCKPLLRGPP